jgi:hypothetical protein
MNNFLVLYDKKYNRMVLYYKKYHRMVLLCPNGKKFATLTGGCTPEASTLPPVTVSRIFSSEATL